MSPAHVLEPTYKRLKSALLSGVWEQHEKLEAQRLADDFGVSMTPVRDCLNRLVGEGLVEFKPGEGYRVPQTTEKALRDMLDLNLLLISHALQRETPRALPKPGKPRLATYPERVGTVFLELAQWSGNSALCGTVSALNDRLARVRHLEPQVFPEAHEEIEHIARLAFEQSGKLKLLVAKFHDKRRSKAAALVELLDTSDPAPE
jgi:DNA-binding GntR family transcriptional regulator